MDGQRVQELLDSLIQEQIATLQKDKDKLHADVIKCLNKIEMSMGQRNDKKRSRNGDEVYKPAKRVIRSGMEGKGERGIDMTRYDSNSTDIATLQAMNSYLDHQLILLQDDGNLNKTITNQWAINNEFISSNLNIIQKDIDRQELHLKQLNKLLSRQE